MQGYMQHQARLQQVEEARIGTQVATHHHHVLELARRDAADDRAALEQAQVALMETSEQQQSLLQEVVRLRASEQEMEEEHARWRREVRELTKNEMTEVVAARAAAAVGADQKKDDKGDQEEDDEGDQRPVVPMRSELAELHASSVLQQEAHGELMQAQVICYGNWNE